MSVIYLKLVGRNKRKLTNTRMHTHTRTITHGRSFTWVTLMNCKYFSPHSSVAGFTAIIVRWYERKGSLVFSLAIVISSPNYLNSALIANPRAIMIPLFRRVSKSLLCSLLLVAQRTMHSCSLIRAYIIYIDYLQDTHASAMRPSFRKKFK